MLPFPFNGTPDATGKANDYTRFNPEYFQRLEKRLLQLQAAGIEADCILFHPYDAWGYKAMPNEVDDFYLRYAIARLAAFRNVWWSIANEYDLVRAKTMSDWDHFFRVVQAEDPYSHLRSIHHSRVIYDHSKPWCTHASLQSYDFEKSAERRLAWNKPIIYDEIQYEGDVERRWGNLSAEEMTRRFWLATIYGSYASHGEVFISADSGPHAHESSWSDAGRLRGDSASRIKFLRDLVARDHQHRPQRIRRLLLSLGRHAESALSLVLRLPSPRALRVPAAEHRELRSYTHRSLRDDREEAARHILRQITHRSAESSPYQAIVFRKVSDVVGKPTGKAPTPEIPD